MAKKTEQHFDIMIIGSGIAGSNSALLAAQAGLRIALVEQHLLGGSSANYYDIPLGVFNQAARIFEEAKRASIMGLRADTISYNFPSIKLFKERSIQASKVTDPDFYEQRGVTVILGQAQFVRPDTVSIKGQHYRAKYFVIATGAGWRLPQISGLEDISYQTPETLINCERPPRSLFVIGGHKAGLEVASIMASFGTKVFLTEIASRLLPEFDEEVGDFMETHLRENLHMTISTSSRVRAVRKEGDQYRVQFNHAGVEREVKVEQILLAATRQANTDLGLNNAAVNFDGQGVITNKQLQSSNKHIYAIGAVTNAQQSSSESAILDSQIATRNLLRLAKQSVNYDLIPKIINTYPQVISIGLSEDDCERRCINCRVGLATSKEAPYSLITPNSQGFVKLITNSKLQLIGATILLDQATYLVDVLSLAIQQELSLPELTELPFSFLSASELINVAAEKLL